MMPCVVFQGQNSKGFCARLSRLVRLGAEEAGAIRKQELARSAIELCQSRNARIVDLLSKPSLTAEDAAVLARESAALFTEIGVLPNARQIIGRVFGCFALTGRFCFSLISCANSIGVNAPRLECGRR